MIKTPRDFLFYEISRLTVYLKYEERQISLAVIPKWKHPWLLLLEKRVKKSLLVQQWLTNIHNKTFVVRQNNTSRWEKPGLNTWRFLLFFLFFFIGSVDFNISYIIIVYFWRPIGYEHFVSFLNLHWIFDLFYIIMLNWYQIVSKL